MGFELDWIAAVYDLGVEVLSALLLAIGGAVWALARRARRKRELLAESLLGIVRTIHRLANAPLGNDDEEAERERYFAEFLQSQMEAELRDGVEQLTVRQNKAITSFRNTVDRFKESRDGRKRTSDRYKRDFNAVVDAAQSAVKCLVGLNKKLRAELGDMRFQIAVA